MSNKCNVIKDILPLYAEDMVSTDTREFVSEHLEHCTECHAEFERMRNSTKFIPDIDTNIVPLKRIKKDLFIRRLQTIFFTAILACAIVMIAFGVLTAPRFFPYSDDLFYVVESPNGNIIVTFDDKVTGYSCTKEFHDETGTEVYRVNAWTTTWDLYLSNRGNQNVVIPSKGAAKIQIFFTQNNGSEDVLIYGPDDNAHQGIITLPRQILLPYFTLALFALVILAVLRFLLNNKPEIIVWIDRAIFFPISYMAAQLCTKGVNFTTYSSQRDFCIIALAAILFYLAMLTGKSLFQAKKAGVSTERFKEQP